MVEPQPAKKPIWNTGGSNRTEPTSGEKVTGWSLKDQPPGSYFNWLQYYTGAWLEWLNERFLKGTNEIDLIIRALQPDSSGAGGDLTIQSGGAHTSGGGGALNINAGQGLNGEGGDITVNAGPSTGANGGDYSINGGTPVGTDLDGGLGAFNGGPSTGLGSSRVVVKVAEPGPSSGSYTNTVTEFVRADGNNRRIQCNRRLRMVTSAVSTSGDLELFAQAQPTSPPAGDVYHDSSTNQMAFHNGTRYHNLNSTVFHNCDQAYLGVTPSSPSAITAYALQEISYGSGTPSSSAFRHIIPANSLRVGTIIRVRAYFALIDENGGSSTFPVPKIYVGAVGSGPPYSSPTGVQVFSPSRPNTLIWGGCFVECELSIRGPLTASCGVDRHWNSMFDDSLTSSIKPIDMGGIYNVDTLNVTSALDVFPVALYASDVLWAVLCTSMTVDIL